MLPDDAVIRLACAARNCKCSPDNSRGLGSHHGFDLLTPAIQQLYAVLKESATDRENMDRTILTLSRGTAIILLILYVMYLWFQLRTHKNLFDAEEQPESPTSESDEEPCMGPVAAVLVLVVTTVIVAICAEYLVDSIDSIVESAHISKSFIGLILIPIVGNAAEHVTAVVVAIRNKMDLAMGVAIGSSIQIALLVTPFLVMVGWVIDRNMTLRFETFETVAFAASVLVVTYTVQDGRSNYLEGAMVRAVPVLVQFCAAAEVLWRSAHCTHTLSCLFSVAL